MNSVEEIDEIVAKWNETEKEHDQEIVEQSAPQNGAEDESFKVHFWNYALSPRAIFYSTIYQTLLAMGILHPVKGTCSSIDPENKQKRCA